VTPSRFHVSDALWERIEQLLPRHKNTHIYGGGRPRASDRTVMDGILFVLRTGCQWNALNETGICSSSTAHRRFQEWEEAGVFRRLWKVSLENYDELRGIDWRWQAMDGAMTKAPLGGEKGGAQSHGSGQGWREKKPTDRRRRNPDRARGGRREPA
jgi:transposase